MKYKCSACGDEVEGDLIAYIDHTQEHIIEVIKEKHPHWVEEDGICKKCLEYFEKELKGQ